MNEVSAPCGLTEDREKVFESIINIFPDAVLDMEGEIISGTFSDLTILKKMIAEQRIRDTARQVLEHSISDNFLIFHLNKQAAFVSKVNFTNGNSTLGDIKVKIQSDDTQVVIDHLAPRKEEAC